MSSNTPAICPHVEIVNGHLQTNSFKIAEHFGKQHKNVIRDIDNLECSPEFRRLNFEPTQTRIPIHNGGHRYIKAYTLTRDGFTFLAMGFTGKEAAKWKEAYIEAFNRMEAALSKPTPNALRFLPIGEPGQRVLIRFEPDGSYVAMPVPDGTYVMTPEQFLTAINAPNGVYITTDMLCAFIRAANDRLESRAKWLERERTELATQLHQAQLQGYRPTNQKTP